MLLWSHGPRWDGDETAASVVGILRTRHLSRQSRLCPREPSVRNDSFGPGVLRRCREAHWRPFRWVGGRLAWANQRRRWRTVLVLNNCANETKSEDGATLQSRSNHALSRPQAARAVYARWAVLGRVVASGGRVGLVARCMVPAHLARMLASSRISLALRGATHLKLCGQQRTLHTRAFVDRCAAGIARLTSMPSIALRMSRSRRLLGRCPFQFVPAIPDILTLRDENVDRQIGRQVRSQPKFAAWNQPNILGPLLEPNSVVH